MAMMPDNFYHGNGHHHHHHHRQQQYSDQHRHWGSHDYNHDYYNHHGRRSSSSSATSYPMMEIPEGALPGGRYVQRHHLHLTSSGDHSYDYMEYNMPWEEEGWGECYFYYYLSIC